MIQAFESIPPLIRTINLVDMVAYAGATWDWYKLHYDPEAVAQSKLPGPVVDGQVFGALLVEQLQDHFGPKCFVQELNFKFNNLVFAGETVRCEAEVTKSTVDCVETRMRVVVIDQNGVEIKQAISSATAVVLIGFADGIEANK